MYLSALKHRVTVRRNATSTSASGATKFNYSTVATGVRCRFLDKGGRMVQDDLGQVAHRKHRVIFGPEMSLVLQQNDLLVTETEGEPVETYKVFHLHPVNVGLGRHVKADVEQLPSAGGD